MNSEENKKRFISSSEAKENSRSAYYKLLESAREGNMVCIRRGVYATMEQLADTMIDLDIVVPDGILCLFSASANTLRSPDPNSTVYWVIRK